VFYEVADSTKLSAKGEKGNPSVMGGLPKPEEKRFGRVTEKDVFPLAEVFEFAMVLGKAGWGME